MAIRISAVHVSARSPLMVAVLIPATLYFVIQLPKFKVYALNFKTGFLLNLGDLSCAFTFISSILIFDLWKVSKSLLRFL